MSDKLPPEVLKLLGDDATPERVAADYELRTSSRVAYMTQGGWPLLGEAEHAATVALTTYRHALSAAAIRECEARREYPEEGDFSERRVEAVRAAESNYDTLRGLKQSLGEKK